MGLAFGALLGLLVASPQALASVAYLTVPADETSASLTSRCLQDDDLHACFRVHDAVNRFSPVVSDMVRVPDLDQLCRQGVTDACIYRRSMRWRQDLRGYVVSPPTSPHDYLLAALWCERGSFRACTVLRRVPLSDAAEQALASAIRRARLAACAAEPRVCLSVLDTAVQSEHAFNAVLNSVERVSPSTATMLRNAGRRELSDFARRRLVLESACMAGDIFACEPASEYREWRDERYCGASLAVAVRGCELGGERMCVAADVRMLDCEAVSVRAGRTEGIGVE